MTARSIATAAVSAALLASMAIPAYAETPASGTVTNAPAVRLPLEKGMNLACVQTAVDARETAIGTGFGTFAAAQTAALAARKTALHDAWGMTEGKARRAAREKAWGDYRTASKAAHAALRTAREDAWKAFKAATADCKVPVVESSNAEGVGSLGL